MLDYILVYFDYLNGCRRYIAAKTTDEESNASENIPIIIFETKLLMKYYSVMKGKFDMNLFGL